MNSLVINCGSSSLKFSVIDTSSGADLARGLFDRLGSDAPAGRMENCRSGAIERPDLEPGSDHETALDALAHFLNQPGASRLEFAAVGHRVVHGGEHFTRACLIEPQTIEAIEACSPLAPLHNPANLLGIRKSLQHFPDTPQVAVFDTAFHQSLEPEAYRYAIPAELYREHRIRRYGFHGTSHKFVTQEAASRLGTPLEQTSLITAHLGNGCSAAAIDDGLCVDTTMGLTPLEGLVMGTRSGDLDPGIIFHLHRTVGMDIDAIDALLNKRSGLLGLSELSNDMRSLREAAAQGNDSAGLALRIFTRRLAKSIAALRATLRKMDALVFTGGIGENDALTRAETLSRLQHLGFEIDAEANATAGRANRGIITTADSGAIAMVVPTNEELMIARETEQLIEKDLA